MSNPNLGSCTRGHRKAKWHGKTCRLSRYLFQTYVMLKKGVYGHVEASDCRQIAKVMSTVVSRRNFEIFPLDSGIIREKGTREREKKGRKSRVSGNCHIAPWNFDLKNSRDFGIQLEQLELGKTSKFVLTYELGKIQETFVLGSIRQRIDWESWWDKGEFRNPRRPRDLEKFERHRELEKFVSVRERERDIERK